VPSDKELVITWLGSSLDDISYDIYFAMEGSSDYVLADSVNAVAEQGSANEAVLAAYSDLGLSDDDGVCFIITAITSSGESLPSDKRCVTL